MNGDGKPSRVALLWIMLFLVSIGSLISWRVTSDYWRSECVRRGHARWVVTSDAGAVKWEWITK
jgi:hypothetical protein